MQELKPAGIVVVGTTAVAHYYYSTAAEDRDGKRKTTYGRYTDVLIKQDGNWVFIAWRGRDDPRLNE
jgi:ketosteroid isomerase-like protein